MCSYNSYEQAVIRMIAVIPTYFIIYYGNIIFRRVRNIAKSYLPSSCVSVPSASNNSDPT